MIKLVASDLDGTLLQNGAQQLSEELYPLIRQLKAMGIHFVAASGRQYANMHHLFEPVKDDMAYICENGAMAVEDNQIIYQDSFDPDLVQEIITAIDNEKTAEYTCSTKDFYYVHPKTQEYYDLMAVQIKNVCKVIHSNDEIVEPCMKLAVYEKEGMQDEMIRYWQERFADRCTVVTSGFAWVDFIPFGTNKAKGIREFQKKYDIKPDECIVFGDEYNDIEMLKEVKYSFAMANAKDGVKEAANYIADRVEPILQKLIEAGGKIEEVI